MLVDANIFIYAFMGRSRQCRQLLERCKSEEVFGITTAEIVSEVCHRLMIIEAVDEGVISKSSAADLKRKQAEIQRLTLYWLLTSQIFNLNIPVLPLDGRRLHRAQQIRATYGLLTNDSLIAAAAQEYGINSMASRDNDFDRLRGVTIYKPSDLP